MRSLYYKVMTALRWVFGAMPARRLRSPLVYRIAHYGAVVLITVLLAYFSDRIKDPAEIDLPYALVRRLWFGILFLLAYLFIRLVIYLIGLLFARDEPEFADIEYAWNAGMAGLQRHGMDIRWLPTVLVNGLTVEQERNLFAAAGIPWKVVAPPLEERNAVLRFFASDDGLFISCTGVGAVSMQRTPGRAVASSAPAGAGATMVGAAASAAGTLRREDLAGAAAPAAAGGTLRAVPRPVAQQTMLPPHLRATAAPGPAAVPVETIQPLDHHELALAERRVRFLCHLASLDRQPYCAINGMIQTVPVSWSLNQRDASRLCPSVAADMEHLVDALELQFPAVLMMTDLDQLAGFSEFLERCGKMDNRFRNSRAGSRFPTGAAIDAEHSKWAIERSLHWFRGWIYSSLAQDLGNTSGNRKLFRLLCDLSDRRGRLEYLLHRSFEFRRESTERVRLSGCYFAATGDGSPRQGFVQGVLMKVLGEQSDVAWSRQRLRRDRLARSWAWILLLATGLLIAGDAYVLWLIVNRDATGTGL